MQFPSKCSTTSKAFVPIRMKMKTEKWNCRVHLWTQQKEKVTLMLIPTINSFIKTFNDMYLQMLLLSWKFRRNIQQKNERSKLPLFIEWGFEFEKTHFVFENKFARSAYWYLLNDAENQIHTILWNINSCRRISRHSCKWERCFEDYRWRLTKSHAHKFR